MMYSTCAHDLNGDGKLDIVVSDQACGTATVSVLIGNGDGTFQAHADYGTGQGANWVTVGDFNGDGKLDLAVTDGNGCGASALLVLLGNGDGTFQTPVSYPLNTNGASAATADFNHDGKLDLAVVDNIGLVSIFLGKGDGTFQSRVDYSAGSFPWGSIGTGDFNGDGNLDLAVANSGSNTISVFLGKGDGTFQPQVQVGTGAFPQGVAVGDFNRDGALDLAVPNYNDNTVSILLQATNVTLLPASLAFANQVVGSASAAEILTLTNTGALALTISGITVTGTNATDFGQTNNCGSRLAIGAACTISVTFKPTHTGPRAATVTMTGNPVGSPLSIPLSGIGVVSGPNATLSTTKLTFATQLVGTSSATQSVTLTNYGSTALGITSIAASGDFSASNTCGSTLSAGASCTLSLTFTPTKMGSRTGTLSIADDAPGSPQKLSLQGTGTVVELNPTSLGFGTLRVGLSGTKLTTMTNVGSTTLSITGITITGATADFSQTNNCSTSIAAGAFCSISVTFKPTAAGSYSANVTVSDDGGGSSQKVSLSGSGCVERKIGKNHYACELVDESLSRSAVQAALALNQTLAVPKTTGSSNVGTRVMDLVDSQRIDPFLANGSKRELLVRFWYPASSSQGCKPAEYMSPQVWSYFSQFVGTEVKTNSCLNAPVGKGSYPVIVFTHGYTGTFTDYTFLFEDLASRGYVVASVDHTYEATAVEFPDGRLVKGVLGSHFGNTWRIDDQALSFALSVRLKDLEFLANELERLNRSPGSPFAGRLDTSRIGLMGHSLGGQATISGVEQDSRFRTGVVLDGVLDGSSAGTDRPILMLAAGREQWGKEECKVWGNLRGPRLAVNLKGAEHLTPSDAVWLAKGTIKTGDMGPDKTVAAMRDYVAAFLDANLRGKPMDDPLLTGPSSDYADAVLMARQQSLCGEAIGH